MSRAPLKTRRHDWDANSAQISEAFADIRAPDTMEELRFTPQPMVAWYSPKELVITGFRAAVSAIFGTYADKREVEAALWPGEWVDYSAQLEKTGELWIDYVADLGDGWAPTYTVARLIGNDELTFDTAEGPETTRRGHILVMGGDQVYPTATQDEYRNRLTGPYHSALPGVSSDAEAPHLYAVPGNHDWYDGLNSFVKQFCQGRWIGAWRTQQKRSYFAFKLSDRLWVWGIDIQLSANIDKPQLDYFEQVAAIMTAGSSIVLCTAEPSWAYVEMHTWQKKANPNLQELAKQRVYKNFGYLQDKIVRRFGHDVLIALAGDAHEYARYAADEGNQQRFVAGGGGAYLYPTHHMPDTLTMPEKYGGESYSLNDRVYPDKKKSRSLARRCLLLPFFRGNWSFTAFLGSFYLLLAWVMQSVSKHAAGGTAGESLLEKLSTAPQLEPIIKVLAHSPGSVAFILVLTGGLVAFSPFENALKKLLHGGAHALLQVGLFLAAMSAFAHLNLARLALNVDAPLQVLLFAAEMLVVGGVASATLFGLYLWLSNWLFRLHDNEVLLCQSNPDYKHFLRLKITADGKVRIFPVGVPRVGRFSLSLSRSARVLKGWLFKAGAVRGEPWFESADAPIESAAELIEEPITVPYPTQTGE